MLEECLSLPSSDQILITESADPEANMARDPVLAARQFMELPWSKMVCIQEYLPEAVFLDHILTVLSTEPLSKMPLEEFGRNFTALTVSVWPLRKS